MKNEIFDKMLDNLLDEAIPEYLENQKYDDAEDVVFSERHKENMKKMFDGMRRKRRMQKFNFVAKKVAVVVIAGTVAMVLFSPHLLAWRSRILDMFIQDHGEYSWIIFEESESSESGERDTSALKVSSKFKKNIVECFNYMPYEDYYIKILENKLNYLSLRLNFIDNKCLYIMVIRFNSRKAIDTEGAKSFRYSYNNNEYDVFYANKENINVFSWTDDDCIFRIRSNLQYEDIVNIIKNIDYKKIKSINFVPYI